MCRIVEEEGGGGRARRGLRKVTRVGGIARDGIVLRAVPRFKPRFFLIAVNRPETHRANSTRVFGIGGSGKCVQFDESSLKELRKIKDELSPR